MKKFSLVLVMFVMCVSSIFAFKVETTGKVIGDTYIYDIYFSKSDTYSEVAKKIDKLANKPAMKIDEKKLEAFKEKWSKRLKSIDGRELDFLKNHEEVIEYFKDLNDVFKNPFDKVIDAKISEHYAAGALRKSGLYILEVGRCNIKDRYRFNFYLPGDKNPIMCFTTLSPSFPLETFYHEASHNVLQRKYDSSSHSLEWCLQQESFWRAFDAGYGDIPVTHLSKFLKARIDEFLHYHSEYFPKDKKEREATKNVK